MQKIDNKIFLRNIFIIIVPILLLWVALDRGGTYSGTKEMFSILLWGLGFMVLIGLRQHFKIPFFPALFWSLFWLWGFVTLIFTYSPDGTLRFLSQMGALIVFAWAIYNLAEKPLWKFFRLFYIGVSIVLLIGFFFLLGSKYGFFVGRHDMMLHFISTFYWKNPAAGYLILVLPLSFVLAKYDPTKGWRIFYWLISISSFAALFLTLSRAAWLAFALAAIVIFLLSLKISMKFFKILAITIIIGFVLSILIMPPKWVLGRFSKIGEVAKEKPEEPVEERWMMLSMGLNIVSEKPLFGIGFEAFKVAYPHFLKNSHYLSSHLHNQYLQYAAEGGIPAFILFLCAIFSSIGIIFISARKNKDPILWAISLGTLAYAIHIGLDFDWNFWGTSLPFLLLIAIGIRNSDEIEPRTIKGIKKISLIVIMLAGFLFSTAIGAAWTIHSKYESALSSAKQIKLLKLCSKLDPFSAYFWYQQSTVYKSLGDTEKSRQALKKAYSLEPKNILIGYEYASSIYSTHRDMAVNIMFDALNSAPYILPEKQLDLADYLMKSGEDNLAEKILANMPRHFSTDTNVRYTGQTAGFRYILGRAYEYWGDIVLSRGDFRKADSLYRVAGVLECPRYKDKIAEIWAVDTPSPEWIVSEFIDAVNIGDTVRLHSIIADSAIVKLTTGIQIYLASIMNVQMDILTERASVDALVLKCNGDKEYFGLEFFNLILTDDGWKIKF
ncbi:O-antigen ligase family protein [bacterium]|nr:O-antigen ligase family protein [bacterium]